MPAFWVLLSGMSLMLLGDVLYMLADLNVLSPPARLLDLPYGLAFLCAGATALHASMGALTLPGRQRQVQTTRFRIIVIALALAHPHRAHGADRHRLRRPRSAPALLLGIMTAAAVLRTVEALRMAEQSEARLFFLANHDGLYGPAQPAHDGTPRGDPGGTPGGPTGGRRAALRGPGPFQAHQRHAGPHAAATSC